MAQYADYAFRADHRATGDPSDVFWYRRYLRSRQLLQEEMNRKEKLVALGHLAARLSRMRFVIRCPLSKGWQNTLLNARQRAVKRMNWRR